jgi:arylsulfatase A-like enzyme
VVDMYQDWQMTAYSPEITSKPERFEAYKAFHERGDWLMQGVAGKPLERVKPMTLETTANMDQDFAAWSEGFIREAAQDGKPFYLVHAFSKVHFYNIPAKGYAGRSPAGTPYRDGVVEVDDIVGRLVKTLKDTGQLENTFVFFTSDNGPEEDSWPDTGHTPFRGAKGTTWEGGVRVPGIAYWPGMIAPGRRSDGLFDLMDLYNTSLAIAGATDRIPDDRYIDGIDQSSFLLADKGDSRREIVWMWNMNDFAAMRVQEFKGHYRLYEVDNNNPDALGGLNNSRVMTPMNPWFYNLYNDPKERMPRLVEKVWAAGMMNFPLYQHAMTFRVYPNQPALATLQSTLDMMKDE